MRFFSRLCFALAMVLASVRSACAAPPTSLDVHGDRVAYYSNRYVVTADGHVRIRLSDGTHVSGEYFQMDLKLNRYILAGDVHLDSGNVHEIGAAFAGYPDLDRSYFLPAMGAPDRWTYLGLDFAHPDKGRQQPGDAFFIPDISDSKPYILASNALILPKTDVKFNDARIYVLGVYVPTVSWVQNFSANPNYAQNAFAGAVFDVGVPYQGSAHAISALHLRYNGTSKLFLSFDQHFVWNRDWLVFSVNPLTQEERQYNVIGYKRISPKMELRLFGQESAAQRGVYSQPEVASSYVNLQYTYSARHSALFLNADQYNESLLQYPDNSTLNDQRSYDHPADAQISWLGRDTALSRYIPVYYRLRSGFGLAHDGYHCGAPAFLSGCNNPGLDIGYVLDYFGATRTRVPTIWQHYAGFTLYTASLPLDRLRSLTFNVTLDRQRQWFSLPHYIDDSVVTATLSKTYTRKYAFFGAYSITQLNDVYGARQREFYPMDVPTAPDGTIYRGYEAFRGLQTLRALTGSAIITPNERFNYVATVRRALDFPGPIPGIFGNPPWTLTNEVRFRLSRQILLDVARTDYFNFGGYQPQYTVTFGP